MVVVYMGNESRFTGNENKEGVYTVDDRYNIERAGCELRIHVEEAGTPAFRLLLFPALRPNESSLSQRLLTWKTV